MIAGAWLAFACAVFVLICYFVDQLGRRVVGARSSLHLTLAKVVSEYAALGFASLACLALLRHLFFA